jgi:Ni,Fe-hydrogenase maturation factor
LVVSGEDYDEMRMELSEPVRAAVDEAVEMVVSLVEKKISEEGDKVKSEDPAFTWRGGESV